MLVDDFMPVYEVSDTVAALVEADVGATWNALMKVDLVELGRRRPLVGVLGALRALPEVVSDLLRGKQPAAAPTRLRLHDLTALPLANGGWILLDERPGEEIALGLVGKFWRPIITFTKVDAASFRDFAEPGFAKTVYSLAVRRVDDSRTLLTGTMRTATTDEPARRWFRRYWTFGVGSGAHVLVNELIDAVRESAERVGRPAPA